MQTHMHMRRAMRVHVLKKTYNAVAAAVPEGEEPSAAV